MNKNASQIYEFGPFRLYANDRILFCGDRTVRLTEKVFNLLLLLVERSGHLVTKDELLQHVWSDSIVEENNLTVRMSALRKALGERQEGGQYIETVAKRGYRFVATVREMKDGRIDLARENESETPSRTQAVTLSGATITLPVLPLLNILLDYALAVSGRRDEASKTMKELQEATHREYVDPTLIAVIYAGLNEKDQAFKYLEKAYEDQSIGPALLNERALSPRFTSSRRRGDM